MYKVHCMNNIAKVGTDALGPNFELTDDERGADAFLVRSANLHEVDFSENLLAIGRAGAGVNNIPLDACAEKGIVVFNTPGANANAVKELVLCGMLLASRDIIGGVEWVAENSDDPEVGKKAEKAKKKFAGTELAGKTLGVIGLGAIGTMVANTARRLGMHVYGYDPYLSVKAALSLDSHTHAVQTMDEVLAVADYLTIHVPAMPATKGMLSAEAIAKMKDGVVVLNFARDSLVDERAMAEALQTGHVARYVTDFANSVSTQMAHAIVTPHLGASTKEAEDNCAVMAANEIRLWHGRPGPDLHSDAPRDLPQERLRYDWQGDQRRVRRRHQHREHVRQEPRRAGLHAARARRRDERRGHCQARGDRRHLPRARNPPAGLEELQLPAMYKIHCLNNIAPAGLEALGTNCELTENLAEAEAVLVRSANMHELEVGDNLRAGMLVGCAFPVLLIVGLVAMRKMTKG